MLLRKWNYKKHEYEPISVPDEWDCKWYDTDMSAIVNCCQCGKETTVGKSYGSLEIHTLAGLSYMVCEKCHIVEIDKDLANRKG